MLRKRGFLIINLHLKGFSFSCLIDPFRGHGGVGTDAGTNPKGQLIQGPMWAAGGLPCSRAPRQCCEGVLALNNTSQRTTQGASTAPITFITFIMTPTPISQSANQLALVHTWISQCCDGAMVLWRPRCRENRSPHVNVTTVQPLTV